MKRKMKSNKIKYLVILAVPVFVFLFLFVDMHVIISEVRKHLVSPKYINISTWRHLKYETCSGHFIGYGHEFAVLKNVILKPNSDKFYIPCGSKQPKYQFNYGIQGTHLNKWMTQIESTGQSNTEMHGRLGPKHGSEDKLVVAVLRYEYANLYHTFTDWYNVYILAKLLDEPIDNVAIILYDENVKGHLDETWVQLFRDVIEKRNISNTIFYSKMAWGILGYESPINFHATIALPLMSEFINFFLSRYGILDTKLLDCSKINITFIWRRDYVAHPLNPTGLISRKVKNEEELISHFQTSFPKASVKGVQLDQLTFQQQLNLIVNTDILISMHGAGLTHIFFLPDHAGVVEMFPLYWKKYTGASHFRAISRWKKLKYSAWQNLNPSNEFEKLNTYIPPVALESYVRPIYKEMCSNR